MIVDSIRCVSFKVVLVELLRLNVLVSFIFGLLCFWGFFLLFLSMLVVVVLLMMLTMFAIRPVQTLVRRWTTKIRNHEFDDWLIVLLVDVELELLIKLDEALSCFAFGL